MNTPPDPSEILPADSSQPETRMLDITHEKCPMTFVRTRLALDGMAPGSLLAVRLKGEEPHKNVRRSVLALGHAVLSGAGGRGWQRGADDPEKRPRISSLNTAANAGSDNGLKA
ncbi:hypothetical protein Amal_01474 [Acetobacter malorum]|uniref:UPF0033 domain-containing protein n=1 Tax=Acetobacter malorum TaxID=178901 RepID=A0A177GD14_9PROT|nr:hypothetical protein Amal_01474 [Acetobacter malorum]